MSYQTPQLKEVDTPISRAGCCTYAVQYPVNGGKFVVNGDCIVP